LAKIGHNVIGVDTDRFKVEAINGGRAPFYEPALDELISGAVSSGKLTSTADLAVAVGEVELVLICVGTPSDPGGNLDLTFLRRVCEQIAEEVPKRDCKLIVSIRSTVFPGVNEQIYNDVFGCDERVSMVSNPEFLREGSAVKDFLEPSLIVVGGDEAASVERVASIYEGLPCAVERVSLRTAETIKYACNAFHAVKVAFANEVGSLCRTLGVEGGEVMRVVCEDRKLNISSAYLKPGFAFGGSCLPKDLRAMNYRAKQAGLSLPLLENVLKSNTAHLERLADRVKEIPVGRIAIYGLAFKENTDDLRESAVIEVIERLLASGRMLRIYDPHIDLNLIYGANQRFLFQSIPHIGNLMLRSVEELLTWCDLVVITQKPTDAVMRQLADAGKRILDLTA
jgi:GDP-mannose 6-dehydrogenase